MEKAITRSTVIRPVSNKWIRNIKKYHFAYLLMLPSILLTLVFNYFPMPGILVAFQDFNLFKGILHSPWVGMKHIHELFNIPLFKESIINTINLSLLTLLVTFPTPIILALLF